MQAPTFGGKPSDSHVIWRGLGGSVKRFDERLLRRWCSKYGVDYESSKRVDHDRGSDPRQQHRIVFAWDDSASESFAVGDDEWEIRTQKTPRTFIEIDSEGEARIRSWDSERVLDVHELIRTVVILYRRSEAQLTYRTVTRPYFDSLAENGYNGPYQGRRRVARRRGGGTPRDETARRRDARATARLIRSVLPMYRCFAEQSGEIRN
jgi:hypothetical protein